MGRQKSNYTTDSHVVCTTSSESRYSDHPPTNYLTKSPVSSAERTPLAVWTGAEGTGIRTPGKFQAGRLIPACPTGPGNHASRPAPRSACASRRPEAPRARCMLGVVGSRPRPAGCGPPFMRLPSLARAARTRGTRFALTQRGRRH